MNLFFIVRHSIIFLMVTMLEMRCHIHVCLFELKRLYKIELVFHCQTFNDIFDGNDVGTNEMSCTRLFVWVKKTLQNWNCFSLSDIQWFIFDGNDVGNEMSHIEINSLFHWVKLRYFLHLEISIFQENQRNKRIQFFSSYLIFIKLNRSKTTFLSCILQVSH